MGSCEVNGTTHSSPTFVVTRHYTLTNLIATCSLLYKFFPAEKESTINTQQRQNRGIAQPTHQPTHIPPPAHNLIIQATAIQVKDIAPLPVM